MFDSTTAAMEIRTCACALNNMGVAMMVNGDIQAASRTLKDALSIMLRLREQSDSLCLFARDRTVAASSLLSKVSSSQRPCWMFPVSSVESHDVSSLKQASVSQYTPSFTAVLIREPSAQSDVRMHFDRESGIILYNYGLACHLLCTTLLPANAHDQMKNDATKSLLLSHTTFSNILFECEDACEDLESLFLATLVLSCTAKVFRACNEPHKAAEAEEAVDTLMSAVHDDESMAYQMADESIAAAAA